MVAATPIPCCSCAIASRSSSSTLASTSVAAWIHDKYWRVNEPGCQFRAVRRRSSLFSWQAERYGSFRSGFCNPSTSASTSREAGRVERACCVKDSVEGVEPWPLLGGAKGWVLGMAMACLLVLGDGESLAAMRVPKSPRTGYDPVSEEEREASSAFARRVAEALDLLDKARKAQARDDFEAAFRYYSLITQTSGDLALADYARVGRALTLYEVGDRDEAIAEMEDMTLSLKGYPEVHAALAAALYTDKHAPVPAEQQFTFATLLDPRYTDPSWLWSKLFYSVCACVFCNEVDCLHSLEMPSKESEKKERKKCLLNLSLVLLWKGVAMLGFMQIVCECVYSAFGWNEMLFFRCSLFGIW